jgi:hypothetical protein
MNDTELRSARFLATSYSFRCLYFRHMEQLARPWVAYLSGRSKQVLQYPQKPKGLLKY